jgi:hypothetical protein
MKTQHIARAAVPDVPVPRNLSCVFLVQYWIKRKGRGCAPPKRRGNSSDLRAAS